jgi:hypothetical protein
LTRRKSTQILMQRELTQRKQRKQRKQYKEPSHKT